MFNPSDLRDKNTPITENDLFSMFGVITLLLRLGAYQELSTGESKVRVPFLQSFASMPEQLELCRNFCAYAMHEGNWSRVAFSQDEVGVFIILQKPNQEVLYSPH